MSKMKYARIEVAITRATQPSAEQTASDSKQEKETNREGWEAEGAPGSCGNPPGQRSGEHHCCPRTSMGQVRALHGLEPSASGQRKHAGKTGHPHASNLPAQSVSSPQASTPDGVSACRAPTSQNYPEHGASTEVTSTGTTFRQQTKEGLYYRHGWGTSGDLWALWEFSRVRAAGERHCFCPLHRVGGALSRCLGLPARSQ